MIANGGVALRAYRSDELAGELFAQGDNGFKDDRTLGDLVGSANEGDFKGTEDAGARGGRDTTRLYLLTGNARTTNDSASEGGGSD